jgi:hypothetical protein
MRIISKQITTSYTVQYHLYIIKVEIMQDKANFFWIGGQTQTALHSEDWDDMKNEILTHINNQKT